MCLARVATGLAHLLQTTYLRGYMELVQGSPEWLADRKKGIGSSDAPVVMKASPYMTPYELWLDKLDRRAQQEISFPMLRGTYWEKPARAMFELKHNIVMDPITMVHPTQKIFKASLDGFNPERNEILEIKVAGREVFEKAKDGVVDERYIYQLEHQAMVSGCNLIYFYCVKVEGPTPFKGEMVDDALVKYVPDAAKQNHLMVEELKFWDLVENQTPPELMESDVLIKDDEQSKAIFESLKRTQKVFDEAEAAYIQIKERLKNVQDLVAGQMLHTKEECNGVRIRKLKNGIKVTVL
jgi:putative phage-type endonuclease